MGSSDISDNGRDGPSWLRRGWARVIVLAAALAFLTGAAGYAIGASQDPPPFGSDLDVAFLQDMADHHDQAVTMSIYATENATDLTTRNFAREVIIFQRYELGLMDAYLGRMGHERGDLDREVMGWMGTPVPLDEMPGLATPEEMAALRDARGIEADILFLELMIEHHHGGIHMATDAAVRAASPEVRRLADYQARVQRSEIAEYESALERLRSAQAVGASMGSPPAEN